MYIIWDKRKLNSGRITDRKSLFGDTIYFNGKEIPTDETGEFMIGLERLHPTKGLIKVVKNKEVITRNLKSNKDIIQKINNLMKIKLHLQENSTIELKKKLLGLRLSHRHKDSHYHAGFIMPAEGIITGVYGSQRILNEFQKDLLLV